MSNIVEDRRIQNDLESVGKRALVLSGGGLCVAYQAGVYKALWPHWKPELVVGVSGGALNGWHIAAGMEPGELIELWLHPDAGAVKFRDSPGLLRGLLVRGLLDPAPVLERARRMQAAFPRKLPFGVVAIEVPGLRPHMFRDDQITPEHLLATCSIPLLYPPVRIGGRRYSDGGMLEPLPLWAAAAMGATHVIAVNAVPKVTPWPIKMAMRSVHRFRRMPVPSGVNAAIISPSGPLGGARDAITWKREAIQRWIDMGIRDGEKFLQSAQK